MKKYNPFTENKWFLLMCIMLVILLVTAGLCGAEVIYIPNWVAGIWVAGMFYALHKAFGLFPDGLNFGAMVYEEEEDEEEDEDDFDIEV